MGLFLSATGVIGSTRTAVEGALRDFALAKGGRLEPITMPTDYWDALIIAESGGNVTVMYPSHFFEWQPLSAQLSVSLQAPVFFLHIHDGDLWMYELYVNGSTVDQFNPIPNYWSDKMTDMEKQSWAGSAATVARWCRGVREESISKYLVRWNLDDHNRGKAYSDDEFVFQDWQMIDFMRKIGLPYPIDQDGKCHGEAFQFSIPKPQSRRAR